MAKITKRTAIKGYLDLEEGTMTEFNKEGEATYKLEDLLMPYHGIDNVAIVISYDSEIDGD